MSDAIKKKTIKGVIDRYLIRQEINGSFVSQVYKQATSIETHGKFHAFSLSLIPVKRHT
jgi:hypothetical protein